jgi:hypothetical protein
MTMREEIIEKILHVDHAVLERVKRTLEQAELESERHQLPDIRVKRTPEEISEIHQLLDALAEPMPQEDLAEFLEATKRRPLRSRHIDFGEPE